MNEKYNFNFSGLSEDLKEQLPVIWNDYSYNVTVQNYFLKVGYGYNWVMGRHWLVSISESPMFGMRKGEVNNIIKNRFMIVLLLAFERVLIGIAHCRICQQF